MWSCWNSGGAHSSLGFYCGDMAGGTHDQIGWPVTVLANAKQKPNKLLLRVVLCFLGLSIYSAYSSTTLAIERTNGDGIGNLESQEILFIDEDDQGNPIKAKAHSIEMLIWFMYNKQSKFHLI